MRKILLALLITTALLVISCVRVEDVSPRLPTATATATWSAPDRHDDQPRRDATPRPPQSGHDKVWITPTGPTATAYSYP